MRPSEELLREKFEAWAVAPPFELDVSRHPSSGVAWPGDYKDINVSLAWQAWKACAEQSDAQAVAYMFEVKEIRFGRRREFAAIDYYAQEDEEIVSKIPLYAAAPKAPEGSVSVPLEPTEEMLDVMYSTLTETDEGCPSYCKDEYIAAYKAMLAKAPASGEAG